MMQDGFRQLFIIKGKDQFVYDQLKQTVESIAGDWLTITRDPILSKIIPQSVTASQAKNLLGQEFQHGIFDATLGFNLEAFAILTGTLIGGSLLILLLPENFESWQDEDSLRWNENPEAICVPNFVCHLQQVMSQYLINNFPNEINNLKVVSYLFDFIRKNNKKIKANRLINNGQQYHSYQEQSQLLKQIQASSAEVILLTAKRGRGKSALAGLFARHNQCWVTAPSQAAVITLKRFAKDNIVFIAPDELLSHFGTSPDRPDWLIIDEAAMIPLPILQRLLNEPCRILLTTTIDGYEGTGQGLLLKLFKQLERVKNVAYFQLTTPIRWLANDPVEDFTEQLVIANHYPLINTSTTADIVIRRLSQAELVKQRPSQRLPPIHGVFSLLKNAHYRTSLVDLRRLLDAQNMGLFVAQADKQTIATVVTIKEGGLNDELIDAVYKGERRPKGNLVAQSLVAHANEKLAAKLLSIRINRIAVDESMRYQGIATQLIKQVIKEAQVEDFISVSFAYSNEMWQFWSKQGFHLVHIGSHKEASSGCYAAMAIYPLSKAANDLVEKMVTRLAKNWYWYQHYIDVDLAITINQEQTLTDEDKQQLFAFATSHHSYEASIPALHRLSEWLWLNHAAHCQQDYPIITKLFKQQQCIDEVITSLKISGWRDLLKVLRQEVYKILMESKVVGSSSGSGH